VVHDRASIARVAALPVGLVVIVAGGLYDVVGWVLLGLLILFVLTLSLPPLLERLPLPAGLAKSELIQLAASCLLLAAAYMVARNAIHPHWIGWSQLIRGWLVR